MEGSTNPESLKPPPVDKKPGDDTTHFIPTNDPIGWTIKTGRELREEKEAKQPKPRIQSPPSNGTFHIVSEGPTGSTVFTDAE